MTSVVLLRIRHRDRRHPRISGFDTSSFPEAQSINRTGWKRCAASVDNSSKWRGDRLARRCGGAVLTAGSRARRRLEPPLCKAPARRRAVNRDIVGLPLEERWRLALNSLPNAVSTGRTVPLRTTSGSRATRRSSRYGRAQAAPRIECVVRLPLTSSLWMYKDSRSRPVA